MNGSLTEVYILESILGEILTLRSNIRKNDQMKPVLELHVDATSLFRASLERKDYETLFRMEFAAQGFDEEIIRLRNGKPENRMADVELDSLHHLWKDNQNRDALAQRFDMVFEKYKNDFTRHQLKDNAFVTGMNRLIKQLGVFANGTSDKEEHFFYHTRINCLRNIGKEHQNRIDRTVGFVKTRGMER